MGIVILPFKVFYVLDSLNIALIYYFLNYAPFPLKTQAHYRIANINYDSSTMTNNDYLSLTLDQLTRATREIQYCEGLVPAQWEALRYLASANRYSLTPGMVANFLGTTKGTASQTLRSLENKGYVKRVRSQLDKRVTIVTPTTAGLEKLTTDPLGTVLKLVEGEDDAEKEILYKSLERLLSLLRTHNNGCHFGYCAQCKNFRLIDPDHQNGSIGFCRLSNEDVADTDITKICAKFTQLPSAATSSPTSDSSEAIVSRDPV